MAVTAWAKHLAERLPGITRIGYFGSYARGDWGVGSDLDVLIVLKDVTEPLDGHVVKLDLASIPVPVDTLIYSEQEWQDLIQGGESLSRRSRLKQSGSLAVDPLDYGKVSSSKISLVTLGVFVAWW